MRSCVVPPAQRAPLEPAHERVGDQAEHGVGEQADDDDVGAQEVAGVVDEVAEAGVGVDLLGDDQREPGDAERLAEADERAGQRAGDDDVAEPLAAASAGACAATS